MQFFFWILKYIIIVKQMYNYEFKKFYYMMVTYIIN